MTLDEIIEPDARVYELINQVKDNYIFADIKNNLVYCTKCQQEYPLSKLYTYTHNENSSCALCNKNSKVKYTRFGRKTLIHQFCILTFKKNDNDELIAVGYYVKIHYLDYKNPTTKIKPVAYYKFGRAGNKMFKLGYRYEKDFVQTSSIYNFNINWLARFDFYTDNDQFDRMCENTNFSYIKDKYKDIDSSYLVKFLDLYTSAPGLIEKMLKMNLNNLIEQKVYKVSGTFSLKDKNKTVYEALHLTKGEYRYIIKYISPPESIGASSLQRILQLKKVCNITELKPEVVKFFYNNPLPTEMLKKINMSVNKYYKYCTKQMSKNYNFYYRFKTMYEDYIRFLIVLNIDITNKNIAPDDLERQHDIYSKKIKLKNNEEQNKKIKQHYKKLQVYNYENKDYFIRAVKSMKELIDEGEKMHHCVATYADKYANELTSIFVVRNKKFPDKPLVTVEIDIKTKKIVQSQGKNNTVPPCDINEFIEEFYNNKLAVKKKRKRVA